MSSLEEQIKELEDELVKTPYNKATSKHIGRVKAKIARLKDEAVSRAMKAGGGGEGYAVKKSGDATAVLVGFPSTGKSTLLNKPDRYRKCRCCICIHHPHGRARCP